MVKEKKKNRKVESVSLRGLRVEGRERVEGKRTPTAPLKRIKSKTLPNKGTTRKKTPRRETRSYPNKVRAKTPGKRKRRGT